MPSTPSRDDVVVTVPVYEPAGQDVRLTLDDLNRHTCILGSTGAGKSTLLLAMVEQIIRYQAGNNHLKPAILLFDGKQDATSEHIGEFATRCGRSSDIQILDGDRSHRFDLFAELRTLDAAEEMADKILTAVSSMGSDHGFWTDARRTMLTSALRLLTLNAGNFSYQESVGFLERVILRRDVPITLIDQLQRLCDSEIPTRFQQELIQHELAMLDHWSKLDVRTISNIEATLAPVFRMLHSRLSQHYFAGPGSEFCPNAGVQKGLIQLVTCDAVQHPEFARFLFRRCKEKFFTALQSRRDWGPASDRLAVIVADEWPLIVSERDTTYLATCRAKGGCFVAATQGFASIDEILGPRSREALTLNLNNLFFFRNTEPELDHYAARILGYKTVRNSQRTQIENEYGTAASITEMHVDYESESLVCRPGALAGLETHRAFVKLGSNRMQEPIWFAPTYQKKTAFQPSTDSDNHALKLPEGRLLRQLLDNDETMKAHGYAVATGISELSRIFVAQLEESDAEFVSLEIDRLAMTESIACGCDGLTTLPASWLKGLRRILPIVLQASSAHITTLAQVRGRLIIKVKQAENDQGAISTEAYVRIQASLYPSPYRPMKRRDKLRLHLYRSEALR